MKRLPLAFGVTLMIASIALPVHAEPMALSGYQIDVLRQHCVTSQAQLKRLQTSDALLRANLGQRYENISVRLMAPMNSRVALAGHDGVELTTTTVAFNTRLDAFRADYTHYESALTALVRMDCKAQPVEFYQALQDTRLKREVVHEDVQALGSLVSQYRAQFERLAKSITGGDV